MRGSLRGGVAFQGAFSDVPPRGGSQGSLRVCLLFLLGEERAGSCEGLSLVAALEVGFPAHGPQVQQDGTGELLSRQGADGPSPSSHLPAGSHSALARSLQAAEALLRHCVHPSWRRLLPLRPGPEDPEDREEEEEASPGGLARLAQVEQSFLGLSRACLSVREDPHTETFQGHLRPEPAQAAFSFHATRSSVARHCTTLHALLQQRHHLRLARHYSRRLKAASDFVRRLRAVEGSLLPSERQDAGWGRLLRGLCEELRTHTTHWDALQRHMCSDPWLRPMLLQRPTAVLHMRRAFSSLARQALCLLERCLEALLRHLARAPCLPPAPLSEFFQGLDIYNQVVRDQPRQRFSVALWAEPGPSSDLQGEPPRGPSSFPMERVLGLLAAESGQRVACKLRLVLLGPQAEASGVEAVPWEGSGEAWLLGTAPRTGKGAPSLSAELQALGQAEEERLLQILGGLVASTGSLWHHLLSRPKQEQPPEGLEASGGPGQSDSTSLPAWKAVRWLDASYTEAAGALYTQCRPLVWSTMSTSLAHQLELHSPPAQFPGRIVAVLGQELRHTPFHGTCG